MDAGNGDDLVPSIQPLSEATTQQIIAGDLATSASMNTAEDAGNPLAGPGVPETPNNAVDTNVGAAEAPTTTVAEGQTVVQDTQTETTAEAAKAAGKYRIGCNQVLMHHGNYCQNPNLQ